MKTFIYIISILTLLWLGNQKLQAQETERLAALKTLLDSAEADIPGLGALSTLSLRDVPVSEYIRAIGIEHEVNVYIPDDATKTITHNLVNEKVSAIFLFICKRYSYTLELTGTILEFIPYSPPKAPPIVEVPRLRPLNISYEAGKLSADLKNDSLFKVIKTISSLTGKKIVTRPGTDGLITAFLPPTNLDTALEAIFLTNGFPANSSQERLLHFAKDARTRR